MGYSFLDFMKRIGIFIVCAQSFLHFTAGKSYEKYVKLLIGIMILAQFIVPVRMIFHDGESGELWDEIERFTRELQSVTESLDIDFESENDMADMLEEEIKEKIEDTARGYGLTVSDVEVYEEPAKLVITVSGIEQSSESGKITVEKITIGGEGNKAYSEEKADDRERTDEMRHAVGIILGVDESYIEIRMK